MATKLILAGTDRVAIDAVGVVILRYFGTTDEVSQGKFFEQSLIAHAIELSIGIQTPNQIEFVPNNVESTKYAKEIQAMLNN